MPILKLLKGPPPSNRVRAFLRGSRYTVAVDYDDTLTIYGHGRTLAAACATAWLNLREAFDGGGK
jgi:hypothetical protein